MPNNEYQDCIDACLDCATACNYCAAACLEEKDVRAMAACIKKDMECAAICYAAAHLMSLGSEHAREICKLCATICDACAKECGQHDNDHCRKCAEACRTCADVCRSM